MPRLLQDMKRRSRPLKVEANSDPYKILMNYPRRRDFRNSPVHSSMEELPRPRLRPMQCSRPPLPPTKTLRRQESSSSVVVYRSAKYDGMLERWRACLKTYAQLMVLQAMPIMHGFHDCLIQILGALYLVVMSPMHIFITLVLLFLRKLRFYLVRRSHPEALICEDLSPRCIFVGKSLGMVTSMLWLRGRVDIRHLRSSLLEKCKEVPVLTQKLDDLFGLRVFLPTQVPFDIQNHVLETPREMLKHFVSEDKLYCGKSSLERYVTQCVSKGLHPDSSPWQVIVIPLPVFKKEKTCVVLRFHHVLLNFPDVRQSFFEGIFTQSIFQDVDVEGSLDYTPMSHFISEFNRDESCAEEILEYEENVPDGNREVHVSFHQPVEDVKEYMIKVVQKLFAWFQKNLFVSRSDLQVWMDLRIKQMQFHSKAAVLKAILKEYLVSAAILMDSLNNLLSSYYWVELKSILSQVILIVRAVAYVPIEVYSLLICPSPKRSGFRRVEKNGARRFAWSSPISDELMKAIKKCAGVNTESVVLTACSLALKDYYCEIGLPNPQNIGVLLPVATSDLLAPSGYAAIDIPTDNFTSSQEMQKMNKYLRNYPPWILLGHYFFIKYISYLVPRPVAYLVMRRLFRRYPVTFNKVNLQYSTSISLPHISLWDKTVDEFLLWKAPHSDFCVSISLFCYGETSRLAVMSPMKSLDTVLVHKFSQNLNKIAEAVGVNRNLIPYSRRSSPSSSFCSSPLSIVRSQENLFHGENDDDDDDEGDE